MTNEQLAEIEARAAAATPGEWKEKPVNDIGDDLYDYTVFGDGKAICWSLPDFDAEFIAHSRQDIPALVAEVKRLQNGITKIESRWREASQDKCFRSHYRGTMSECADELRDLLAGSVDEDALRAEIDKAFEGGKL